MRVINHKLTTADLDDAGYYGYIVDYLAKQKSYTSLLDKFAAVTPVDKDAFNGAREDWPNTPSGYYTTTKVAANYTAPATMGAGSSNIVTIETENDSIFVKGDYILVLGIRGYEADGRTLSSKELVLYVEDNNETDGLQVSAVNGKTISTVINCVPSIEEGTTFVKMGNDVEGTIRNIIPSTRNGIHLQNFFQTVSVDERALEDLNKQGWEYTMKDMVRMALNNFKLTRDMSLMYSASNGTRGIDGIWDTAGKTSRYSEDEDLGKLLNEIDRVLLCDNSGRPADYIFLAGTKCCSFLASARGLSGYDLTVKRGSMVFNGIAGKITIYPYALFDDAGQEDNGIIFPAGELLKYSSKPLTESYSKDGFTCQLSECCALGFKNTQTARRIIKR